MGLMESVLFTNLSTAQMHNTVLAIISDICTQSTCCVLT